MSESISAFDIAASGMAAQRTQMDVIAANLANADVRRSDGTPYRPQTAVFESTSAPDSSASFADALEVASGDSFEQISFDDTTAPAGVRFRRSQMTHSSTTRGMDAGKRASIAR